MTFKELSEKVKVKRPDSSIAVTGNFWLLFNDGVPIEYPCGVDDSGNQLYEIHPTRYGNFYAIRSMLSIVDNKSISFHEATEWCASQ